MLWLIATILIVLWLGTVTLYTMNGLIHIFLLVAGIMILIRQIKGRSRIGLITGKNKTDKLDGQ